MRAPRIIFLALVCLAPVSAHGADAVDKDQLAGAIDKGLTWLKGLQQPDGSFAIPAGVDSLEKGFPMGYSALATLTLLKCGTPPGDPVIEKAFRHLYTLKLRKTYSVSMLVLAIEARYAPPPSAVEKKKKAYTTTARKFFRAKAGKQDLAKLQECVNWLLGHRSKQHVGGWRYPEGEIDQDNSCTQYAMLALKGARRLGADVPMRVFEEVADFFVQQQDPTGAEVESFPVPAADGPIAEMATIEQRRKLEKKRKKEREKAEARGGTITRGDGTKVGEGETYERRRMFARGWSYEPREIKEQPPAEREGPVPKWPKKTNASTGSMTCSGVAALCIAKSELENSKSAWRPRQVAVNQAIRDGCAWLAHYFSPTSNPCSADGQTAGWKYYYLYSVERAGVLAGTYTFGPHDWWEEGAAHLLTQQEAEGTWPDAKGLSKLSRSCFALLFLARATVPLVPLPPKRVMTGVHRQ